MNYSKILIICWTFILGVTILAIHDLMTQQLFIMFFGRIPRGAWYIFVYTSAASFFFVWAIGCAIVLTTSSVVCRKLESDAAYRRSVDELDIPKVTDDEYVNAFLKKCGVDKKGN